MWHAGSTVRNVLMCERHASKIGRLKKGKEIIMTYTNFIGIDVSKNKIDVFVSEGSKLFTIPNNANHISKAFKKIDQKESLVVLENTGGYERTTIDVLMKNGFAVHRTDNIKVKGYMRSLGNKAKTDSIDAMSLAKYGKERHDGLKLYEKVADSSEKMNELVKYRDDLKRTLVKEKNRLKSGGYWIIRPEIENTIKNINGIIKDIERKIKDYLSEDEKMSKKINSLTEYVGIGFTSATQLCVYLNEIGNINRKEISSLAGLAPYANDSGKMKGYRFTRGGRGEVKRVLYMVAMCAIRKNENISKFYRSLVARGKKKKVALIASMRKILIQCNAIVKKSVLGKVTEDA